MNLEIHLVGGDESVASDVAQTHAELYRKISHVEMPVSEAINLHSLLHAMVYVKDSEESTVERLTTILDECTGLMKLPAIKHLRERMKLGLKTAKYFLDAVEAYKRAELQQYRENITIHKNFIQKILEIFEMEGWTGDDEEILKNFRDIKNRLDDAREKQDAD